MRTICVSLLVLCPLVVSPALTYGAEPFDHCGWLEFIDVEGGCWRFLADDGNGYEVYGNYATFTHGAFVRVVGIYAPGYSICMVGLCCVGVDTVLPCEGCCNGDGIRGDASGTSGKGPEVDVADLTYIVAYLFFGGPPPLCPDEANVDGIHGGGGPVDVADMTYLVEYLFQGGPAPASCP